VKMVTDLQKSTQDTKCRPHFLHQDRRQTPAVLHDCYIFQTNIIMTLVNNIVKLKRFIRYNSTLFCLYSNIMDIRKYVATLTMAVGKLAEAGVCSCQSEEIGFAEIRN
jgi:hypothetical protein